MLIVAEVQDAVTRDHGATTSPMTNLSGKSLNENFNCRPLTELVKLLLDIRYCVDNKINAMTFSGLFLRKASRNFLWCFRPAVSSEQKTALTFVLLRISQ